MNNNNYLAHFGVKGMKWGVRRESRLSNAKKNYKKARDDAFKKYEKAERDIERPYKRGQNLSDKDYKRLEKADRDYRNSVKNAKNKYKLEKKQIKSEINKTYKKIKNNASLGEKLIYNSATRRAAAKFIVDNNMSYSDAMKKAKTSAWRNSAIALVGSIAALGLEYKYLYK